jgi:tripartite-type tricarboxylate transporter receptor subunit TctC
MNKVLAQPEIQEKIRGVYVLPTPGTPQALGDIIKYDHQLWGKVVKANKISID